MLITSAYLIRNKIEIYSIYFCIIAYDSRLSEKEKEERKKMKKRSIRAWLFSAFQCECRFTTSVSFLQFESVLVYTNVLTSYWRIEGPSLSTVFEDTSSVWHWHYARSVR